MRSLEVGFLDELVKLAVSPKQIEPQYRSGLGQPRSFGKPKFQTPYKSGKAPGMPGPWKPGKEPNSIQAEELRTKTRASEGLRRSRQRRRPQKVTSSLRAPRVDYAPGTKTQNLRGRQVAQAPLKKTRSPAEMTPQERLTHYVKNPRKKPARQQVASYRAPALPGRAAKSQTPGQVPPNRKATGRGRQAVARFMGNTPMGASPMPPPPRPGPTQTFQGRQIRPPGMIPRKSSGFAPRQSRMAKMPKPLGPPRT